MLCNKVIGGGKSSKTIPSEWAYFRNLANDNESAFLVASGGIDTIAFTGAEDFVMKIYGGENGTQLLYTLEANAGETADLWSCDTVNFPLPTGVRLSYLKGKPYSDNTLGEVELFTVVTSGTDGNPVSVAVAETEYCTLGLPRYRILACDLNLPAVPSIMGCVKNASELEFVYLKNGMTEIPEQAFYNTGLKEYKIPSCITSIKAAAFYGTRIEKIDIPETVISLGEYVFSQCSFLEEVNLPENLTEISPGMFSGCTLLKKINIPQSVTSICDNAFFGCRCLSEVELPSELTNFSPKMLFANCDVLDKFEFFGSIEEAVDATDIFANCHQIKCIDMPNVTLKAFGCPGKSIYAKNKIGSAEIGAKMPITLDWANFADVSDISTVWNTSYTKLNENQHLEIFEELFSNSKYFENKTFIITGSDGATDIVRDYITNMLGGICVG